MKRQKIKKSIPELIVEYGIKPKASLGQHFLICGKIVKQFVALCRVDKNSTVIEIGPGTGVLTAELAKNALHVVAIEEDKSLSPILEKTEQKFPNVRVEYANALKWEQYSADCVCGSLSYSIFEPFLRIILTKPILYGVFLISSVFCKNKKRRIWVLVDSIYNIKCIKEVPPDCFYPQPKTSGAIITLSLRIDDNNAVRKIMSSLVLQKHKKLKNALREVIIDLSKKAEKKYSTKKSAQRLISKYIDSTILNNYLLQISEKQFMRLYNSIKSIYALLMTA